MRISVAQPESGSSSTVSRSNWNSEMLVFVEGGKPEYPEKNPRSKDENQQQTRPRYHGVKAGNWTQAALVGGECSHHYAIPAPTNKYRDFIQFTITSLSGGSRGVPLPTPPPPPPRPLYFRPKSRPEAPRYFHEDYLKGCFTNEFYTVTCQN